MKRICHITSLHPPNDPRIVFKEIKTLVNAGYSVDFIVRTEKVSLKHKNLNYHFFSYQKGVKGKIYNILTVFKMAFKLKADIFHLHDPELLFLVFFLKLFRKTTIIYDVHERYYDAIKEKAYLNNIIALIIATVYVLFEKISFFFVDYLILAENNYDRYYHNKKHIIIRNFIPSDYLADSILPSGNRNLDFVYAGAISKARGIFEIINFANSLKGKMDFTIHLIGSFQPENLLDKIKAIIQEKRLDEYIKIYGRIPFPDVQNVIKSCQFGLIFLHPQDNYIKTIPTKFYEFMGNGVVLISSDFAIYKEFIDSNNAGFYIDIFNMESCVKKNISNMQDREYVNKIRKNNLLTAKQKFIWEIEEKKLLNLYDKLTGN